MAVRIGPVIKVDGEKDYRESMSQIIQQTKTLGAEMKALTAGFGTNNNAVKKAQETSKLLTAQIDKQKQAISLMTGMLDKSKSSLGEADVRTLKYQQNVAKAQAELAKMEGQLQQVNTELRVEQSVAEATSSKWGKFRSELSQLTTAQRAHKQQITALKADYTESQARVSALAKAVVQAAKTHGDLAQETRDLAQQLQDAQREASQLGNELKEAGGKATSFSGTVTNLGNKLKSVAASGVHGLGSAIKGGFVGAAKLGANAAAGLVKSVAGLSAAAGAGIVALGKIGFDYNSEMEGYTANFETMLGSSEAATQKVNELKEMAASTPFEMGDLASATQQLIAMGVQSEDTGTYLKQLGDISLGNKEKLGSLVNAFGKMTSTGKVTLESINMMAEQGFNPLKVISEQTGESMTQLYERVSAGKISLDEIKGAMQTATTGTGQFAGGMEKASQTMAGQISTLKDNARALVGEVFKPVTDGIQQSILPQAIEGINTLTTAFQQNGVSGMVAAAGDILGNALGQFSGALPKFADTALNIVSSLASGISNNQGQIANGVVTTITTLVSGLISALPQLLKTGGSLLLEIAKGLAQQLPEIGKQAVAMIRSLVTSLWENRGEILQAGVDIVQGIVDGIASVWHSLVDWFNNLWDSLFGRRNVNVSVTQQTNTRGRAVDGSHAGGLWRVPFDNYVANLHRDEMVLTRSQAELFRQGSFMLMPQPAGGPAPQAASVRQYDLGGVTFIIYQQPGEDGRNLAQRVMEELEARVRQEEEGDLNG